MFVVGLGSQLFMPLTLRVGTWIGNEVGHPQRNQLIVGHVCIDEHRFMNPSLVKKRNVG